MAYLTYMAIGVTWLTLLTTTSALKVLHLENFTEFFFFFFLFSHNFFMLLLEDKLVLIYFYLFPGST